MTISCAFFYAIVCDAVGPGWEVKRVWCPDESFSLTEEFAPVADFSILPWCGTGDAELVDPGDLRAGMGKIEEDIIKEKGDV